MNRTRFISHQGKRILLLDYQNLGADPDELEREIAGSKQVVSREAQGSVLILTDVRGCRITPGAVRAMEGLVRHNAPYVKWSAVVVGLTGVYLTAYRAIQALSRRRNLKSFTDTGDAQDWLISQP